METIDQKAIGAGATEHGPAPPTGSQCPERVAHTNAIPMLAPLPAWPGPPYRQSQPWAHVPPMRPAPKPAPFRAREIAAAIAMVVVCDVALFATDGAAIGGFGLAALFAGVPLAMVVAARARRASVRLACVGAMLAAVVLRSAMAPTALTSLSGLVLVAMLAFALRARRSFVPEMIATTLYAVGKLPSRVGAAVAGVKKLASRTKLGRVALLPIVVPIALCAVFLGVFALANPVVAHGVSVAWGFVASFGLPSPPRVFVWAVALVGSLPLLRPALRLARGSEAAAAEGEATSTALLVSRNALVGLNVLFLAYNALDATYLWSGHAPAGLTTQTYAHEGAFWLTVALAMLTAVVGVMFRGALAHDARAKLARTLAYAWMAQGIVLALGSYRRIAIHIAHSGLSDLRIVGILGTTLVAGGVALVAYKLRTRRTFAWLVRRQLDAFAITVVLYGVMPTHWVASRVNVSRIAAGEYRPLLHMFRQSKEVESAAQLVPLLHHPDARVRQGVAALLEDERGVLQREIGQRGSWRERDLVAWRTLGALDAAQPEIHEALGHANPASAKHTLLEISRVANEDRSWEEIFAIPAAESDSSENQRPNVY